MEFLAHNGGGSAENCAKSIVWYIILQHDTYVIWDNNTTL